MACSVELCHVTALSANRLPSPCFSQLSTVYGNSSKDATIPILSQNQPSSPPGSRLLDTHTLTSLDVHGQSYLDCWLLVV